VLPATAWIAERLRLQQKDFVVMRGYVRRVDGAPALVQRSYYPYDIARDTELATPETIARGTVKVLGEMGHPQVGQRDEVITRMPTPDEARTLELGPGVPVLEQYRTAYSPARPIRFTHSVFAGDFFRLIYNVGNVGAKDL
jgi:GntR family transcriptional regulator